MLTFVLRTERQSQLVDITRRVEEAVAGETGAAVLVYVPCAEQRVLNINTELRVDAGTSGVKNSMSMTTSEGDVDTLFNFSCIRC